MTEGAICTICHRPYCPDEPAWLNPLMCPECEAWGEEYLDEFGLREERDDQAAD